MFSLDALDWAGIWPKAVAGGCKPVYQMKWEINTVLNVMIGFEFLGFLFHTWEGIPESQMGTW